MSTAQRQSASSWPKFGVEVECGPNAGLALHQLGEITHIPDEPQHDFLGRPLPPVSSLFALGEPGPHCTCLISHRSQIHEPNRCSCPRRRNDQRHRPALRPLGGLGPNGRPWSCPQTIVYETRPERRSREQEQPSRDSCPRTTSSKARSLWFPHGARWIRPGQHPGPVSPARR